MGQKNKKRALVTGITGQDGSYLTDLLIVKGYEVHGLIRRASTFNRERIEHVFEEARKKTGKPLEHGNTTLEKSTSLFLHYGDLSDASNLHRLIEKINPDEIYNLAAQSHVAIT
jgi:GDPmannose 4,6-dehydratase